MIGDDAIVDDVKPVGLIEVRMGVMWDLSSAGGPSGMGYSGGGDSSLHEDLLNNSINAVDVAIPLVSILDKLSLGHAGPESEDSCAIVPSVFQEIDSIAQKVLDGDPRLRIFLGFLFWDGSLRNNTDDTTALRIFLGSHHIAWKGQRCESKLPKHSSEIIILNIS